MKTFVEIVTALITLLACASCRPGEAQDTLLVAGSTTMVSYLEPVVSAFEKKHPRVSIVSEPGGSTAGIIALKRGAIDVATVARDVHASEDDIGLRDYLIARDGVAVIVHPKNKIDGLTTAQIEHIVTGAFTSWKDVGGDDVPIVFVDRTKASRTRKSLVDLVLGGDDTLRGAREVGSGEDMDKAVKADPNAVGFVSLKDLAKDAKAVAINGVPLTKATMISGRYPLTRSFYLAVYLKPSKIAEQFVEFTLSEDGQAILEKDGLLGVH
jgi:phosphate transport system substrate-binding protein